MMVNYSTAYAGCKSGPWGHVKNAHEKDQKTIISANIRFYKLSPKPYLSQNSC